MSIDRATLGLGSQADTATGIFIKIEPLLVTTDFAATDPMISSLQ